MSDNRPPFRKTSSRTSSGVSSARGSIASSPTSPSKSSLGSESSATSPVRRVSIADALKAPAPAPTRKSSVPFVPAGWVMEQGYVASQKPVRLSDMLRSIEPATPAPVTFSALPAIKGAVEDTGYDQAAAKEAVKAGFNLDLQNPTVRVPRKPGK